MRRGGPVFVLIVLVGALVFLPTTTAAQDTAGVGTIAGTVVTAAGEPAIAVTVCLVGTIRCAITGADGRFRLGELRPGGYELEITPPGEPRLTGTRVAVRAGVEAVVQVTLPRHAAVAETVTVTAPAFIAPEEVKTSAFLVTRAAIQSSAGALQDVSRYVQALPGVVIGANDFRNDIIVRGGSPLENLFVVDNVEIPNINAFANFTSAGGTVSLLDAGLIQDVTFLTGGYPAPFTNRVSSVLQVSQREGRRDGFHGQATLGFAGAGAILEGPVARGRGSWIVSLRRSFLDLVTDDIGVGGVPVLYTFNGKLVFDVTPRDRVWAVNVSGVDRIRLGLAPDTDLEEELADFDIRYRGRRSATGVNWQRLFSRGVGLLGVSHSVATVDSTVKDLVRDGVPPPEVPVDEVIARGPVVFREGSTEHETTVKYDLTIAAGRLGKVQAGGAFKVFRLRYDTGAPLGNDSPYSLEPGVNPFALDRVFTTTQTGAYVQVTRDLTPRLNLTTGLRIDDYRLLGRTTWSPRAGVSYRLTDRVSWRASAGRYHQQPPFLFVTAFPSNASLAPIRADHLVTGLSVQLTDDTRVGVEAYVKRYADYPVSSQFPTLSLANVGDTFNVREVLFPLVSAGSGRAEGVELIVENATAGRWFGQANLAIARARHAAADGVRRPGAYDYPVVLNLDGGVRPAAAWTVSARLAWLGGRPYTPYDEGLSAAAGRGIYDLARVSARRAPDYFRLDLRAERRFRSEGRPFVVFAGVQNVTNRRNVAGYTWNRRLGRVRVQEQMGVFPIAGFEYHF
ncbi:MAG: TonB-dependent receptor [Vicinamibacterales bacterium]